MIYVLRIAGATVYYISTQSSLITFSVNKSEATRYTTETVALELHKLSEVGILVVAEQIKEQVDIDMESDLLTQNIPNLPAS